MTLSSSTTLSPQPFFLFSFIRVQPRAAITILPSVFPFCVLVPVLETKRKKEAELWAFSEQSQRFWATPEWVSEEEVWGSVGECSPWTPKSFIIRLGELLTTREEEEEEEEEQSREGCPNPFLRAHLCLEEGKTRKKDCMLSWRSLAYTKPKGV